MTSILVLGADGGLNVTGWVLAECVGSQRTILAHGEIVAPEGLAFPDKVRYQARAFRELLERYPGVALVGVEQYTYQGPRSHNPVAFYLTKLVGRFEEAVEHPPRAEFVDCISKQRANLAFGLTGKVSKQRVRTTVSRFLKVEDLLSEHEADAALAMVAAHQVWSSPLYRRTT